MSATSITHRNLEVEYEFVALMNRKRAFRKFLVSNSKLKDLLCASNRKPNHPSSVKEKFKAYYLELYYEESWQRVINILVYPTFARKTYTGF